MKLLAPTLFLLFASSLAFAQDPAKDAAAIKLRLMSQQTPMMPKTEPLWSWSDGAFIGAALADIGSTDHALSRCSGCYEAGAVKSQWLRAGIYAGVETGLKFYEWKHPESRGKMRWLRVAAAATISAVVVNNLRRGK